MYYIFTCTTDCRYHIYSKLRFLTFKTYLLLQFLSLEAAIVQIRIFDRDTF